MQDLHYYYVFIFLHNQYYFQDPVNYMKIIYFNIQNFNSFNYDVKSIISVIKLFFTYG
jgi:hypothetical protein